MIQIDADLMLGLLCSAHGVPKSYVEAGDPYKSHIQCCAALISLSVKRKIQQKVDAERAFGVLKVFKPKVAVEVKLPGA
jgi:protoheme ferro-lyase